MARSIVTPHPRISLEQWRALVAVVDAGGYAQAAQALHKSQSSISYSVAQIEALLGVEVFVVQGRKAVLTPTGQLLYRRAKALVDEAASTEDAARRLSAGWEAELAIAVEIIFPDAVLFRALDRFAAESPHTRIEIYSTVLGGTHEALTQGEVDFAIASSVPPGLAGDALTAVRFRLVAHPDHPLHRLGRPLTVRDLVRHRQLIVRESGTRRATRPTVEAAQRWTVSHPMVALDAAQRGYGYAYLADDITAGAIAAGTLAPLPMREGGERTAALYLVYRDKDSAGPGALRLGAILAETVDETAAARGADAPTPANAAIAKPRGERAGATSSGSPRRRRSAGSGRR